MKNPNNYKFDKWTLQFEEISNNVYLVKLTDINGRQAQIRNNNLNNAIEECLSYSFEIEKQLNNPIDKFTFDIFEYYFNKDEIFKSKNSCEDLISFYIEKGTKRIIFDGNEQLLSFQIKTETENWNNDYSIKLDNLTLDQIVKMKNEIKL
jgi:hypothetical protein